MADLEIPIGGVLVNGRFLHRRAKVPPPITPQQADEPGLLIYEKATKLTGPNFKPTDSGDCHVTLVHPETGIKKVIVVQTVDLNRRTAAVGIRRKTLDNLVFASYRHDELPSYRLWLDSAELATIRPTPAMTTAEQIDAVFEEAKLKQLRDKYRDPNEKLRIISPNEVELQWGTAWQRYCSILIAHNAMSHEEQDLMAVIGTHFNDVQKSSLFPTIAVGGELDQIQESNRIIYERMFHPEGDLIGVPDNLVTKFTALHFGLPVAPLTMANVRNAGKFPLMPDVSEETVDINPTQRVFFAEKPLEYLNTFHERFHGYPGLRIKRRFSHEKLLPPPVRSEEETLRAQRNSRCGASQTYDVPLLRGGAGNQSDQEESEEDEDGTSSDQDEDYVDKQRRPGIELGDVSSDEDQISDDFELVQLPSNPLMPLISPTKDGWYRLWSDKSALQTQDNSESFLAAALRMLRYTSDDDWSFTIGRTNISQLTTDKGDTFDNFTFIHCSFEKLLVATKTAFNESVYRKQISTHLKNVDNYIIRINKPSSAVKADYAGDRLIQIRLLTSNPGIEGTYDGGISYYLGKPHGLSTDTHVGYNQRQRALREAIELVLPHHHEFDVRATVTYGIDDQFLATQDFRLGATPFDPSFMATLLTENVSRVKIDIEVIDSWHAKPRDVKILVPGNTNYTSLNPAYNDSFGSYQKAMSEGNIRAHIRRAIFKTLGAQNIGHIGNPNANILNSIGSRVWPSMEAYLRNNSGDFEDLPGWGASRGVTEQLNRAVFARVPTSNALRLKNCVVIVVRPRFAQFTVVDPSNNAQYVWKPKNGDFTLASFLTLVRRLWPNRDSRLDFEIKNGTTAFIIQPDTSEDHWRRCVLDWVFSERLEISHHPEGNGNVFKTETPFSFQLRTNDSVSLSGVSNSAFDIRNTSSGLNLGTRGGRAAGRRSGRAPRPSTAQVASSMRVRDNAAAPKRGTDQRPVVDGLSTDAPQPKRRRAPIMNTSIARTAIDTPMNDSTYEWGLWLRNQAKLDQARIDAYTKSQSLKKDDGSIEIPVFGQALESRITVGSTMPTIFIQPVAASTNIELTKQLRKAHNIILQRCVPCLICDEEIRVHENFEREVLDHFAAHADAALFRDGKEPPSNSSADIKSSDAPAEAVSSRTTQSTQCTWPDCGGMIGVHPTCDGGAKQQALSHIAFHRLTADEAGIFTNPCTFGDHQNLNCHQGFPTMEHIYFHMTSHFSTTLQFVCTYAGCAFSVGNAGHDARNFILSHLASHRNLSAEDGLKQEPCSLANCTVKNLNCLAGFPTPDAIYDHMMNHFQFRCSYPEIGGSDACTRLIGLHKTAKGAGGKEHAIQHVEHHRIIIEQVALGADIDGLSAPRYPCTVGDHPNLACPNDFPTSEEVFQHMIKHRKIPTTDDAIKLAHQGRSSEKSAKKGVSLSKSDSVSNVEKGKGKSSTKQGTESDIGTTPTHEPKSPFKNQPATQYRAYSPSKDYDFLNPAAQSPLFAQQPADIPASPTKSTRSSPKKGSSDKDTKLSESYKESIRAGFAESPGERNFYCPVCLNKVNHAHLTAHREGGKLGCNVSGATEAAEGWLYETNSEINDRMDDTPDVV